jgi:hypothetical protein
MRFKSGIAIEVKEKPTASVTVTDGKGSKLVLDQATGDITIEAKNNVNIRSGASAKINLNPPNPPP